VAGLSPARKGKLGLFLRGNQLDDDAVGDPLARIRCGKYSRFGRLCRKKIGQRNPAPALAFENGQANETFVTWRGSALSLVSGKCVCQGR
jgi:hypothetical protein